METRLINISVAKAGGNASPNSKKYSLQLPSKWAQALNITPEDRGVKLSFDGEKIIIEKA